MASLSALLSLLLVAFTGLLGTALAKANLPTFAEISASVLADEAWVQGEQESVDLVRELVTASISAASSSRVSIEFIEFRTIVQPLGNTSFNVSSMLDLDAVDVVITLTDCAMTHHINTELEERGGVLHVGISDLACDRLEDMALMIPIVPPGESALIQLLADLKFANTFYNWDTSGFITIMDDSIPKRMEDTIYTILARNASMSMFRLQSRTGVQELTEFLNELPVHSLGRKFLIIIRNSLVDNVLRVLKHLKMLRMEYEFAFVITDPSVTEAEMSSRQDMTEEGHNLAFIYNATKGAEGGAHCAHGLAHLATHLGESLVKGYERTQDTEMPLFQQWSEAEFGVLRPSRSEHLSQFARDVKTQLERGGGLDNCTLWQLSTMESRAGWQMVRTDVGFWSPAGPHLKDDLFPHSKGNFRARRITVTSVHHPPWQILTKDRKGEIVDASGVIFQMLDEMSYLLNFTYNVREPEDGSWDSMIQKVADKEVMLGAAAFAINGQRMEAVNFSLPLDYSPYGFMYKKPKQVTRATVFLDPFTNDVWAGIAIMTVIIGPIFYIIHRSSYYYTYSEADKDKGLFELVNCIWYTYGAILQQGGTLLPEADSGKLTVLSWWIFVIVVVTFYSGSLVAFLTFPQYEFPVTNLENLLSKQSKFNWGFQQDSVIETYLETTEGDNYKEILEKATRHPEDVLDGELYDIIRGDNHVYLDWVTDLVMLSEQQYQMTSSCDYEISKDNFFFEHVALAFPKDSPWIKKFNKEIRMMMQGGLIKRWKSVFSPRDNECSISAQGQISTVAIFTISDIQGAFIILLGGLILCAFVFGKEKYEEKQAKKKSGESGKLMAP